MLLQLPTEILVQILEKLDIDELFSCQLTSKYLDHLIRQSIVIQYNVALCTAMAEDNPCLSLTVAEKFKALKSSEDAWTFLRPDFTTSIPVTHNQSGVYDLTGGVYLLSNSTRTALHYLKLPSKQGDETDWKVLRSNKSIIDIGLSIFEHDLMVNVVTEPHINIGAATTYDIEIQFIEFSTGNPHPHAHEHRLLVMNTEWEKPSVGIEIVGENLVLILSHANEWRPDNRIFIYEWKTGILKVSFEAPYQSYSGLIFLSESLILLPNTRTNGLDIFRIPPKATLLSLRPILTLNLPSLADGRVFGGISCRSEPNPISPSSIPHMKQRAKDGGYLSPIRPFLANSEDALCIFDLPIFVLQLVMDAGGALNMHLRFGHRLTFVVHRSALVELVNKYARAETEGEPEAPAPTEDTLPGPLSDGETADGVQRGGEDDLGPDLENSRSGNLVPWAEWGPPVTRWFNSDNVSTHWITTTAGQRCVRMASDPPDDGYHFVILDFNPVHVRMMRLWLKDQKEASENEAKEKREDETSDFGRQDMGNTSLDLIAAGHEYVDYEDSPEVAIDLTLQPAPDAEPDSEGDSTGSPMILDEIEEEPINPDDFLYFPTPNRLQVITKSEQVEPTEVFSEPVVGELPYVISASQNKHVYDGVLLDEERVIGIITGPEDRIERIYVHHFG